MGFFTWKTQDTDKSISNAHSSRGTFTVFMTDHKGNVWREDNYDGYGEFGGKDFYVLLAEMNGIEGSDDVKRLEAIDLSSDRNPQPYLSPNLNEYEESKWKNTKPDDCSSQGFFYDEDDEDDEDYWD